MNDVLSQQLRLPCGAVLNNRLAKAAMTEGMADPSGMPTPELINLYRIWSEGGAGLLLSGNIIVDGNHLERPGNVIIEREPSSDMRMALTNWARAARSNGNHFWGQISFAGRQTQKAVNPHPKAPSAIKLGLPGGQFGMPVPLTVEEIQELVRRYRKCATVLQEVGFSGVQIHAAHGYLISQFLSPRSNVREDEYGGSLENRARFLLDIVRSVREHVGDSFPVAVKLNSADFQKGGFAFEDSVQVAKWLEQEGIDLIEISGGNYEQPKLIGMEGLEEEVAPDVARSTELREAYFVDFAKAMQEHVSVPLMVTGGFRQRSVMQMAIETGAADLIGLGRPLCVDTDSPAQLLSGIPELHRYENELSLFPSWLGFLTKVNALRGLAGFATQFWYYCQLMAIGDEGQPNRKLSVVAATRKLMAHERNWLKRRRQLT